MKKEVRGKKGRADRAEVGRVEFFAVVICRGEWRRFVRSAALLISYEEVSLDVDPADRSYSFENLARGLYRGFNPDDYGDRRIYRHPVETLWGTVLAEDFLAPGLSSMESLKQLIARNSSPEKREVCQEFLRQISRKTAFADCCVSSFMVLETYQGVYGVIRTVEGRCYAFFRITLAGENQVVQIRLTNLAAVLARRLRVSPAYGADDPEIVAGLICDFTLRKAWVSTIVRVARREELDERFSFSESAFLCVHGMQNIICTTKNHCRNDLLGSF